MKIDLAGRTALVTGSTRGIGWEIAKSLHGAGASVLLHGRSQDSADLAAKSLGDGRAHGVAADLSSEDGCTELIWAVDAVTSTVDILVNNAGVYKLQPLSSPVEVWNEMLMVNAWSGLRLAQEFVPRMISADNHGRAVFISSNNALMPPLDMVPYSASKMMQVLLANAFGDLASGTTVTSNVLLVGPTRSTGLDELVSELNHDQAGDLDENYRALMANQHATSLLGRPGTPEEIAAYVTFLASPLSSVIRRGVLRAEGGFIPTVA